MFKTKTYQTLLHPHGKKVLLTWTCSQAITHPLLVVYGNRKWNILEVMGDKTFNLCNL